MSPSSRPTTRRTSSGRRSRILSHRARPSTCSTMGRPIAPSRTRRRPRGAGSSAWKRCRPSRAGTGRALTAGPAFSNARRSSPTRSMASGSSTRTPTSFARAPGPICRSPTPSGSSTASGGTPSTSKCSTSLPAGEDFLPGQDPVSTFRRYHPAAEYDRLQIRCWKKTAAPVDLTTTGGHEARFPGRRVFPVRFPMRHYPIRSAAQGERKVFRDRKPRFDPEERARGWHVQYDRFVEGQPVVSDPASALLFDADAAAAGLQIRNRLVEAACPSLPSGHQADLAAAVRQVEDDIVRQAGYVRLLELTAERRQQEVLRARPQARRTRALAEERSRSRATVPGGDGRGPARGDRAREPQCA